MRFGAFAFRCGPKDSDAGLPHLLLEVRAWHCRDCGWTAFDRETLVRRTRDRHSGMPRAISVAPSGDDFCTVCGSRTEAGSVVGEFSFIADDSAERGFWRTLWDRIPSLFARAKAQQCPICRWVEVDADSLILPRSTEPDTGDGETLGAV